MKGCNAEKFSKNAVYALCMAGLSIFCSNILCSAEVESFQAPDSISSTTATSGLEVSGRTPPEAYAEPQVGIPYPTLFRESAPYLRSSALIPATDEIKAGSVEGGAKLGLPRFRTYLPELVRDFDRENAHLKLGPVLVRFSHLSAALLWSDNIHRNDDNRDSDVISILSLGFAIKVELTESFNLAIAGSFSWLPFEGEAGVNLGLNDALYPVAPFLRAQLSYDTIIAGWLVTFSDDLRISAGKLLYGNLEFFEGFEFDEVDRAGYYAFADPRRRHGDSDRSDGFDTRNDEIVYLSNTVSATTRKDFPNHIKFRASVAHEDIVYLSDDSDGNPRERDVATLFAICDRENLRFKPYALYRVAHTDIRSSLAHEFRVGVTGPITDQLRFDGNIGYLWNTGGNYSRDRLLWRLALHHIAGPYTTQSLVYARAADDFYEELTEHLSYRISQVLGPDLTADFFVSRIWSEDLSEDDRNFSGDEFITGLRLNWFVSPKTQIRLIGTYRENNYDNADREIWTFRSEFHYHFTRDLASRLIYQYRDYDSSREDEGYKENMIYVNLTKYF